MIDKIQRYLRAIFESLLRANFKFLALFPSCSGRRMKTGGETPPLQVIISYLVGEGVPPPANKRRSRHERITHDPVGAIHELPVSFLSPNPLRIGKTILPHTHEQGNQSLTVKGNKRVEIGAFSVHGLIGGKQDH